MASKRRNMFHKNKKQETTEIDAALLEESLQPVLIGGRGRISFSLPITIFFFSKCVGRVDAWKYSKIREAKGRALPHGRGTVVLITTYYRDNVAILFGETVKALVKYRFGSNGAWALSN
ncbi:hypothetical protein AAG570_010450 [Ranatra chinensis]|uniref:Uncharacterized protein n=1 Tax=Ranatra chinensis TaxID=642074 RepID=A0ABD0YML1_9HEMI